MLETNKNKQKILRNSFFIIIFTFSIFFLRNIDRLYKEYNRYDYNLLENPYYKISEESFRVDKEIKNYINDGTLLNMEQFMFTKRINFVDNFFLFYKIIYFKTDFFNILSFISVPWQINTILRNIF